LNKISDGDGMEKETTIGMV